MGYLQAGNPAQWLHLGGVGAVMEKDSHTPEEGPSPGPAGVRGAKGDGEENITQTRNKENLSSS